VISKKNVIVLGKKMNVKYSKTKTDVKHKPLGLETWGLFLHFQELPGHLLDAIVCLNHW
jgi:hypothetical protein